MTAKKKRAKTAAKKTLKRASKKAPARKAVAKKGARKAASRVSFPRKAKPKSSPKKGAAKRASMSKTTAKGSAGKIVKPPPVPSKAPSLVGQPAPDFTMPTGDGQTVSLKDFRGKRVLLYFYPKDDTPGCTAQACALRDGIEALGDANTVVIGVSKDSVASHQKFKAKYNLNFLLASDENTGVSEKYGVWTEKSMYGRKYMGIERSTFLIDEKGIVRREWRKVSVPTHYDDVTGALAAL